MVTRHDTYGLCCIACLQDAQACVCNLTDEQMAAKIAGTLPSADAEAAAYAADVLSFPTR